MKRLRERTGEEGEVDALQAPPCLSSSSSSSDWKPNLNANISSANRLGTQETLAQVHLLSIFSLFSLCILSSGHEMKCFVHINTIAHPHAHTSMLVHTHKHSAEACPGLILRG